MNLILIPARAGSKRIKNKNLRNFCGKPLIYYTIDAAIKADIPDKIIYVSTDSEEIRRYAKTLGIEIPVLRSAENSSDEAKSIDVVREAINSIDREIKNVILLQPTSPLRRKEQIEEAFNKFINFKKSVISVTDGLFNKFAYKIHQEKLQKVEKDIYCINGAIYIFKNNENTFNTYFKDFIPYKMPFFDSIDIDVEEEFLMAEALMKGRLN